MSLQEQVYSILIVSAQCTFNDALMPFLPDFKFDPIKAVTSISAAKQSLAARSYDFIIINSPLPDGSGIDFAADASGLKTSVALLLVRSDLYETTFGRVSPCGVYVLPKPTSKNIISQAIDWMTATRERLRMLEKKTVSAEEKIREIQTVNRAKWLLIEKLKISEDDAHRRIEKQAMDLCITKLAVAEKIIEAFNT